MYLALQTLVALLILPNLADGMIAVSRIESVDKQRKLPYVFPGLLKGGQRRGCELALPGTGRLPGALGLVGVFRLSLQLLPQQVQEELLQRLGTQSASIVVGGVLDQRVVL